MKQKRAEGRRKGATGERELAAVLAEFGWPARRGQQRSGLDCADVVDGPPGFHFEVKRTEALRLWPAMEQATRDAAPGETPVVVTRRNKSPWLAILDLRTFLRMLPAPPAAPAVERSSVAATPEPAAPRKRAGRPPQPCARCGAGSKAMCSCGRESPPPRMPTVVRDPAPPAGRTMPTVCARQPLLPFPEPAPRSPELVAALAEFGIPG